VSASRPKVGLFDTSIFIAREGGRPLRTEAIPDRTVVSVVTHAELRAGVLIAQDIETRDQRLDTLQVAGRFPLLPIGEAVARVWSQMRAYLAAGGTRVNVNDMWIAATAAAHEIPVLTQDGDFTPLSGVGGLTVIEV
jgi:predicted nucleic acid-binding protein